MLEKMTSVGGLDIKLVYDAAMKMLEKSEQTA